MEISNQTSQPLEWDIVQLKGEYLWSFDPDGNRGSAAWTASDTDTIPLGGHVSSKRQRVLPGSYILIHRPCRTPIFDKSAWAVYPHGRYQCRTCETDAPENMQIAAKLTGVVKLGPFLDS